MMELKQIVESLVQEKTDFLSRVRNDILSREKQGHDVETSRRRHDRIALVSQTSICWAENAYVM